MNKSEKERITAHIREDHPYIVAINIRKLQKKSSILPNGMKLNSIRSVLLISGLEKQAYMPKFKANDRVKRSCSVPISMHSPFKKRIPANIRR